MPLTQEREVTQFPLQETWEHVVISYELSETQKMQVTKLLREYAEVFSRNQNVTDAAIHQIDTDDSPTICCSSYKVPQRLESEVNKESDKKLEMGIIRPSNNLWASPVVVVVPKPDGTIPLWVDYRKLKSVAKMGANPIPSMERMMEKVASAKFITTLELTKGYWEASLKKTTIEKSAFITSKGLYEFLLMPFGMKTASATFKQMMLDEVLKDVHLADAYIDDVEVDTSSTFEQHLLELRQVLD